MMFKNCEIWRANICLDLYSRSRTVTDIELELYFLLLKNCYKIAAAIATITSPKKVLMSSTIA